jgi:hypothetical protein
MPLVETVFGDGRKDNQNAHRPRKRIRTGNHRPRPLLFIINSEIHPYVASRPDHFSHVELTHKPLEIT